MRLGVGAKYAASRLKISQHEDPIIVSGGAPPPPWDNIFSMFSWRGYGSKRSQSATFRSDFSSPLHKHNHASTNTAPCFLLLLTFEMDQSVIVEHIYSCDLGGLLVRFGPSLPVVPHNDNRPVNSHPGHNPHRCQASSQSATEPSLCQRP